MPTSRGYRDNIDQKKWGFFRSLTLIPNPRVVLDPLSDRTAAQHVQDRRTGKSRREAAHSAAQHVQNISQYISCFEARI